MGLAVAWMNSAILMHMALILVIYVEGRESSGLAVAWMKPGILMHTAAIHMGHMW